MFEVGRSYGITLGGNSFQMECLSANGNRFIMRRGDGALVDLNANRSIAGYKDVGQDWVYFNNKSEVRGIIAQAFNDIETEFRRREEAYRREEEEARERRRRLLGDLESWEVGYH